MSTVTARRVTKPEAKRHFLAGGTVLVSEYDAGPTCPVTPLSTVHRGGAAEWAELEEAVTMWRNRYPNQRFYTVPS
jgi:hypothetical protein